MRRPTDKQREILVTINTVRDAQVRRLLDAYPGCTPSRWVSAYHLRSAFGITESQLRSLVKLGELEMRPTDGFGPEVKTAGT